MAGKPSPISSSVLGWAIDEDGRSIEEIASALKVDEGTLLNWRDGEELPSVGQVTELARVLRRPRALFFMPRPPVAASLPPSFRHPPGADRDVGPGTRRRVRQARRIQSAIASALSDEQSVELPRFSLSSSPVEAAAVVREWLGITPLEQESWRDDYEALRAWRTSLDDRGVLVFSLEIGKNDVRGFSAWDDKAPLIVMNASSVSAAARSFTIGHELGHLVARQDSACIESEGPAPLDSPVERWCEEFAAALLMPAPRVRALARERSMSAASADIADVRAVMSRFRVSARAAALRLIDLGLAPVRVYGEVVAVFRPRPQESSTRDIKRPRRSIQRVNQFGPRALGIVLQDEEPFEALSILRMTVPDVRELAEQVPGVVAL